MQKIVNSLNLTAATAALLIATNGQANTCNALKDRSSKSMMNLSMTSLPERLDPAEAWNYQQFLLIQTVFDTLVRVNENGRIVASLARKWFVSDQGRTYTLKLDSAARFQNGQPVEADDVAYSIARHFWPESKSIVKVYLSKILIGTDRVESGKLPSGIQVINRHELSFKLLNPYPPFLSILAMPGFSILKKDAHHDDRPNGSGPMIGTFNKNAKTWLLRRYESYSGIKPKTAEFCIQEKSTIADVLRSFNAGELDVAISVPFSDLDPTAVPKGVRVVRTDSLVFSHLYVNPTHPLLKQAGFRKDLAGLIYSTIEQPGVLSPFQQESTHFMPKGILPSAYYVRPKNRISARAFRSKWGGDHSNAKLRFIIPKGYFGEPLIKALSKAFEEAGLLADLQTPPSQELNRRFDNHDFDLISMPYMGNFPDPDGFLELLHEGIGFKQGFEPSKNLFKLLSEARFIADPTKRLRAYSSALTDFEALDYVIPLFHVNLPMLAKEGISIPDTSYRYEAELKNLFWQLQEKR